MAGEWPWPDFTILGTKKGMIVQKTQIDITDCEIVPCPLCGATENRPMAEGIDTEYGTSSLRFTMVVCSSCGHCYLNPRPRMRVAPLMYPDNYYTLAGRHERNGSLLIAYMKGRTIRRRLSFFNELFTQSRAAILEVGCGDCALLIAIKKAYPQLECTGMDLVFGGEKRKECRRLGINLIEQPIENAQLTDAAFDLVIMNQLIEHLWSPVNVLQKVASALRQGGMISIETVNLDGYDRPFFAGGKWGGYYFPRHLNLFSSRSLAGLLQQTGYRVVRSYSLLAPIIWAFSMRALLSNKFRRMSCMKRFFSDKNPVCLAIFSLIDLIAISLRKTTSNQKIIARKI